MIRFQWQEHNANACGYKTVILANSYKVICHDDGDAYTDGDGDDDRGVTGCLFLLRPQGSLFLLLLQESCIQNTLQSTKRNMVQLMLPLQKNYSTPILQQKASPFLLTHIWKVLNYLYATDFDDKETGIIRCK